MLINAVGSTISSYVSATVNATKKDNNASVFQFIKEQTRVKLSLVDFLRLSNMSRLTGEEQTMVREAVALMNKVNKGDTSFKDAKSYQKNFDTDHNGKVDLQELATHITELIEKRTSNFIGVNQELHFGLMLRSHYTGGSALFDPTALNQDGAASEKAMQERRANLLSGWGNIDRIYQTVLAKYSDTYVTASES